MADPSTLVPRTAGIVDPSRTRGLSSVDGFVLSRIDGTTPVTELAEGMGIEVEDVMASLLKLEAFGLVVIDAPRRSPLRGSSPDRDARVDGASGSARSERPPILRTSPRPQQTTPRAPAVPPPAPSSPEVSPRTPAARTAPAGVAQGAPPPAPPPAPPQPSAPAATRAVFTPEADVDIDPDHQRQIAELFERLEVIDHYTLLGVPRTADKKAIKRAYFEATGRFHPDRFFRKKLGGAKLKMEAIFTRMTEAHDTLTVSARRADYDVYLGSVDRTRGYEQLLADATSEILRAEEAVGAQVTSIPPPPPSSGTLPPATSPGSVAPRAASPSRNPYDPPTSPRGFDPPTSPRLNAILAEAHERAPSKSDASAPRITVPVKATEPPPDQARRESFARRLKGTGFRAPAPPKVPSAIPYAKSEDAVDALKRRYEDKVTGARTAQARKYSQSGMEASKRGDVVAAATALKVALSFDPENAELKAAHQEAQRAADLLLVDQYLKQADYEEKAEKWGDAARSWQRVSRARESDPKAYERGAYCLLKADGNLHEAASLAQRAVQLAPKDAHYRITLANIYLAAGLALNAKRELDAAAQLAPGDERIASLLKRIAKSGA